VEDGSEIASLQTQDVPEILAQSSSLLSQFQTILGRLDGLLTGVESGQGISASCSKTIRCMTGSTQPRAKWSSW